MAAVFLIVTAAACEPPPPPNPPFWHPGTTVDASLALGQVLIEWDAATGGNPTSAYQINLGSTTGTVVTLVPASTRSCFITGLSASTSYTIVVTARDASMAWSGPLSGTKGNRTTTITTTAHSGSGAGLGCHSATDTDGDGLPNAFETDTGTYVSPSNAGTDPATADTDNDGIKDGDETLGRPGLNLLAMGAKPTHKDLLVETDWLGSAPCTIRPSSANINRVKAPFAGAPITNPDGTTGINFIVDYGQGGAFTGGNLVPDPDATPDGRLTGDNVQSPSFLAVKAAHFAPARKGIFHYSLTHAGGSSNAESGTGGDDTYVGNWCLDQGDPLSYPGILMHEIGHNLDLRHGGSRAPGEPYQICDDPPINDNCTSPYRDGKPNYVSVMNYSYMGGLDDSCTGQGAQWLDYSDGTLAPIHENALDESVGICDGVDIDFNRNGVIDPGTVRHDLTADGVYTVLEDDDDWDFIDRYGLPLFATDPD